MWFRTRGEVTHPPVLFVHGGPGYNSYAFDLAVGERLAGQLRLVLVDHRGAGRSATAGGPVSVGATLADFEALREHLGIDRWFVVAHSFGGALALNYVRRYPESSAGLILVETSADLPDALDHQVDVVASRAEELWPAAREDLQRLAEGHEPPMSRLMRAYAVVGREELQRALHWRSAENQREADGWDRASGLLRCTRRGVIEAYEEAGWFTTPTGGERLEVPGILIGGRHSEVIGEANLRASAAAWEVPLHFLEESGHFPYVEEPDEFTALVTSWVAETID